MVDRVPGKGPKLSMSRCVNVNKAEGDGAAARMPLHGCICMHSAPISQIADCRQLKMTKLLQNTGLDAGKCVDGVRLSAF
jgi:hypothetical protein